MIARAFALLLVAAGQTAGTDRTLDIPAATRMTSEDLADAVSGIVAEQVVQTRVEPDMPYAGGDTILLATRARYSGWPPLCVSRVLAARFTRSLRLPANSPSEFTGIDVGTRFRFLEGAPMVEGYSEQNARALDRRCRASAAILAGEGTTGFFELYRGHRPSADTRLALYAVRTVLLARAKLRVSGFMRCEDRRSRSGGVCEGMADRLARAMPTEMWALSVVPCSSASGITCVSGTVMVDGTGPRLAPMISAEVSTTAAVPGDDDVPELGDPAAIRVTVSDPPVV